MVELAEIDGWTGKNFIGGLISRVKGKFPGVEIEVRSLIPENLHRLLQDYQERYENSRVWVLIDDIDAKYKNTS